jgi:hypothetical protein
MRVFKSLVMVFCLGVLVLSVPLVAKADEWNKETIMTFNQPVEVPNMVLKAGTYEFRLLDSPSDRHVVQILNADGTHLYENVLAIAAYRLEPTDKTVVTFEERAQGVPQAIATWFYPGDNSGVEFVYPKVNRTAVSTLPAKAAATPATPPLIPSQTTSKPASVGQQTNAPTTTEAKPAIPPVTNKPVQMAQTTTRPKPAVSSAATAAQPQKQASKRLPKTASPLPILILLGLLSLGGSAGIHVFSKQSV